MTARTYRELVAWQRAMALAKGVYAFVRTMPANEQFGLASQMRRSAVSVPSNIAEGYGRENRPDFLRFLRTARGSLFELRTQLELAESAGVATPDVELLDLAAETDRVLQGLIRGLARSSPRGVNAVEGP